MLQPQFHGPSSALSASLVSSAGVRFHARFQSSCILTVIANSYQRVPRVLHGHRPRGYHIQRTAYGTDLLQQLRPEGCTCRLGHHRHRTVHDGLQHGTSPPPFHDSQDLRSDWYFRVQVLAASRQSFAFARDGALPFSGWLYRMNKFTGTPVNTVWFTCGFAILLGLLVFAGSQAINAIFSLSIVALYIAYAYVPSHFPPYDIHILTNETAHQSPPVSWGKTASNRGRSRSARSASPSRSYPCSGCSSWASSSSSRRRRTRTRRR